MLDTTTSSFPAAYCNCEEHPGTLQWLTPTREAPFPCIYISVVIAAICVTPDERRRQLPDFNIVEIDRKLTSDKTRTQTSDNQDSAGKQKLM